MKATKGHDHRVTMANSLDFVTDFWNGLADGDLDRRSLAVGVFCDLDGSERQVQLTEEMIREFGLEMAREMARLAVRAAAAQGAEEVLRLEVACKVEAAKRRREMFERHFIDALAECIEDSDTDYASWSDVLRRMVMVIDDAQERALFKEQMSRWFHRWEGRGDYIAGNKGRSLMHALPAEAD